MLEMYRRCQHKDNDPKLKRTRLGTEPVEQNPASNWLVRQVSTRPDLLTPQAGLQLQRSVGNHATNQILAKRQPVTRGRPGNLIQRTLDFSAVKDAKILMDAVGIFHQIEQKDITPEEFALLKTQRQRFMPLLGRFSLARGTVLKVGMGLRG